ncbi:MAG: chorismate mutase [Alphaproteobacteria bacterium]|nr:chorismate mutase [Alphaproteobacteria bacterium]
MSTTSNGLKDFRDEIDTIDIRIHELLMQRAGIVRAIGEKKGATNIFPYQPAREAALLDQLLRRPAEPLGKRAVYSIWREILAASTRLQGGVTLAVMKIEEDSFAYRLALQHFGGNHDFAYFGSPTQVLEAVSAGERTIGFLMAGEEEDSWWHHLARPGDQTPRVVARLPFLVPADRGTGEAVGFVVALGDTPASGNDRSLIVLDGVASASRAAVHDAAAACALGSVEHQVFAPTGVGERTPAVRMHLLHVDGYVTADDERLAKLAASFDEDDVTALRIGGYATPIELAD